MHVHSLAMYVGKNVRQSSLTLQFNVYVCLLNINGLNRSETFSGFQMQDEIMLARNLLANETTNVGSVLRLLDQTYKKLCDESSSKESTPFKQDITATNKVQCFSTTSQLNLLLKTHKCSTNKRENHALSGLYYFHANVLV